MEITAIAKQAWKLCWNNKYLWFFGFFVAGAGGAGGGAPKHDGTGGAALPAWLWPVLIAAAIVGLAALFLHVASEAALIEGVTRRSGDEAFGLKAGLRVGWRHFGRVLRVKLLAGAAVAAAGGLIVAPVLLGLAKVVPLWVGVPLAVALAMVATPAALTGYFAYEYALRFAVLDGAPALDAFRAAIAFLHGRLVQSMKLLATAFAAGVVAGAAGLVLAVPGLVVGVALYFAVGLVPAVGVGIALLLPGVVPLTGALGAFRSAVWTVGFLDARKAA